MLDFVLASGHHLAAFILFGTLVGEFVSLKALGDAPGVRRLSLLDAIYGLSAAAVLGFGIARLMFASKGWEFYQHNAVFWLKMALFVAVGLLSVPPTIAFRRWRKAGVAPDSSQVARVRGYLHAQLALILLILIAAAAMARGFGQF